MPFLAKPKGMDEYVLVLDRLTKEYKNHKAVDAVSLKIPRGVTYGLLGPNGAGKTTIIRMITSIIKPDSGMIYLDGEPLTMEMVRSIGYMPEERGLYKKMKVGEQLEYLARLKGLSKAKADERVAYWFDRFGIQGWREKKVQELSKGMQQKIQFIATVMHEPKLIILDEPFSGLDPINTNLIKSEIDRLCSEGATIIFSTHRMEQVEEICEYIGLINRGKIILEGELQEIKQRYKENKYSLRYQGESPESLLAGFEILSSKEGMLELHISGTKDMQRVMSVLSSYSGNIVSLVELLPSLNDIFISSVRDNVSLYEQA